MLIVRLNALNPGHAFLLLRGMGMSMKGAEIMALKHCFGSGHCRKMLHFATYSHTLGF